MARPSCTPERDGSPYALEVLRDGDAPGGAVAIVKCETTTHSWGSAALRALPRCR